MRVSLLYTASAAVLVGWVLMVSCHWFLSLSISFSTLFFFYCNASTFVIILNPLHFLLAGNNVIFPFMFCFLGFFFLLLLLPVRQPNSIYLFSSCIFLLLFFDYISHSENKVPLSPERYRINIDDKHWMAQLLLIPLILPFGRQAPHRPPCCWATCKIVHPMPPRWHFCSFVRSLVRDLHPSWEGRHHQMPNGIFRFATKTNTKKKKKRKLRDEFYHRNSSVKQPSICIAHRAISINDFVWDCCSTFFFDVACSLALVPSPSLPLHATHTSFAKVFVFVSWVFNTHFCCH